MEQKNRIAIVLGSGLQADGSPSPVTELRARAAAKFAARRNIRLITTGALPPHDQSTHGLTEAEVMAEIVGRESELSSCMIENQSFDTLGNAILSTKQFLQFEEPGTLYVVTSPFHMERSCYIFKQVLGHKWRVRGHEAPEWEFETRQSGAEDALVRARQFFAELPRGDLDACLDKLLTTIPAYGARIANCK